MRQKNSTKNKKVLQEMQPSAYVQIPNQKDVIAEKLRKQGLRVKNDGGVIVAYYKGAENYEDTYGKLEAALQKLNYVGSYGVRVLTGASEFSEQKETPVQNEIEYDE